MNNVIMNALCKVDKYTPNIKCKNDRYFEIYLKNAFVSLKSAKTTNPNVDVILVVNFTLDERWISLFKENNIIVEKIDFKKFLVKNADKWSGAYFKLEAIQYITMKNNYEKILLVDTDTIFIRNIDDIWKECERYILLYNPHYKYSDVDMTISRKIFENINKVKNNYIHYGGEFICGNSNNLICFFNKCADVAKEINLIKGDIEDLGDEQIISIAANDVSIDIKDANPYISRIWNTLKLRNALRDYKKLDILHVPSEKEYGMIKLYKLLVNNSELSNKKIYSILNIKSSLFRIIIKTIYIHIYKYFGRNK